MHRMTPDLTTRHSQLLRGVLDLCLLATIAREPTYGYEMTRRLAERGLGTVAEGSIYPALGRLEREGLVEAFYRDSADGPRRKYYRVTPAGTQALDEWGRAWASTRTAVDAVLAPEDGRTSDERTAAWTG